MSGKRVLLIDADPQGDLTASLGWRNPDELETTLATHLEAVSYTHLVFGKQLASLRRAGRMRGGGNSASCSLCSPRHRYSWSVREFSLLFLTSRILRYNPQSCGCRQVVRPKLPNQFHARFFRKLTKQTITKNQFKGVLFDTPLFFHPFGKQEKRAFLTNF